GTPASDTATITGVDGGPAPSGTVTFYLCDPGLVSSDGCDISVNPTRVGPAVSVGADGKATSDGPAAPTLPGEYCWLAIYSGDSTYSPSTGTDASAECFTVAMQSATVTTASSPTGGGVVPGTQATDTATVTGLAGGPAPGGKVAFYLCGPGASGCTE